MNDEVENQVWRYEVAGQHDLVVLVLDTWYDVENGIDLYDSIDLFEGKLQRKVAWTIQRSPHWKRIA